MENEEKTHQMGIRISGELKEWISEEATKRGFYNDSELVRSILYREKAKTEILSDIETSVHNYFRSSEGQASIQQMIRAEVQSDEVRRLIKQVVDDILKEYVVEEE